MNTLLQPAKKIRYRTFFYYFCLLSFFSTLPKEVLCQHYKELIEKLASPSFHGRGYYKQGDQKAARFIANAFKTYGLNSYNDSYFQPFRFPVNTFPGKMKVSIDGHLLVPGKDYIVNPASPSVKGKFPVYKVTFPLPDFNAFDYSNAFLLIDDSLFDSELKPVLDSLLRFPPNVKGLLVTESEKLTWGVSQKVNDIVILKAMKNSVPSGCSEIIIHIQSKFIERYPTANVLGYIPGTLYPDSFIVFTAHYDHLGRMGKMALFAGANDNASGTAMIMDLAKYYMMPGNRPEKTLVFIAFAGEEAGLVGSEYYTRHPLFPLNQINFLINLDLMGNGSDGVMVVNATLHEKQFSLLSEINTSGGFVSTIGKRGKAKNSDHYWFSEQGVPSFFLYTMGGSTAYHDIYDTPDQLPLTEFEDIKTLLTEFIKKL